MDAYLKIAMAIEDGIDIILLKHRDNPVWEDMRQEIFGIVEHNLTADEEDWKDKLD